MSDGDIIELIGHGICSESDGKYVVFRRATVGRPGKLNQFLSKQGWDRDGRGGQRIWTGDWQQAQKFVLLEEACAFALCVDATVAVLRVYKG